MISSLSAMTTSSLIRIRIQNPRLYHPSEHETPRPGPLSTYDQRRFGDAELGKVHKETRTPPRGLGRVESPMCGRGVRELRHDGCPTSFRLRLCFVTVVFATVRTLENAAASPVAAVRTRARRSGNGSDIVLDTAEYYSLGFHSNSRIYSSQVPLLSNLEHQPSSLPNISLTLLRGREATTASGLQLPRETTPSQQSSPEAPRIPLSSNEVQPNRHDEPSDIRKEQTSRIDRSSEHVVRRQSAKEDDARRRTMYSPSLTALISALELHPRSGEPRRLRKRSSLYLNRFRHAISPSSVPTPHPAAHAVKRDSDISLLSNTTTAQDLIKSDHRSDLRCHFSRYKKNRDTEDLAIETVTSADPGGRTLLNGASNELTSEKRAKSEQNGSQFFETIAKEHALPPSRAEMTGSVYPLRHRSSNLSTGNRGLGSPSLTVQIGPNGVNFQSTMSNNSQEDNSQQWLFVSHLGTCNENERRARADPRSKTSPIALPSLQVKKSENDVKPDLPHTSKSLARPALNESAQEMYSLVTEILHQVQMRSNDEFEEHKDFLRREPVPVASSHSDPLLVDFQERANYASNQSVQDLRP